MKEEPPDLRQRTKQYALRNLKLYGALPKSIEAQVIGSKLLRSGTSAGAHYREAQRSKSNADFVSKIEGGLQELDETGYWLELLEGAGILPVERLAPLSRETDELSAIFVSIVKKIKGR